MRQVEEARYWHPLIAGGRNRHLQKDLHPIKEGGDIGRAYFSSFSFWVPEQILSGYVVIRGRI